MARAISKILFILGSYNVLAYLECIRSYAWSKGHSEPDLGSAVCWAYEIKPSIGKHQVNVLNPGKVKNTLGLFIIQLPAK